MTQINRLPSGGRIDRKQSISFSYNGKTYTGMQGDTVASALLANGVDIDLKIVVKNGAKKYI